jgi:hypothetical protein
MAAPGNGGSTGGERQAARPSVPTRVQPEDGEGEGTPRAVGEGKRDEVTERREVKLAATARQAPEDVECSGGDGQGLPQNAVNGAEEVPLPSGEGNLTSSSCSELGNLGESDSPEEDAPFVSSGKGVGAWRGADVESEDEPQAYAEGQFDSVDDDTDEAPEAAAAGAEQARAPLAVSGGKPEAASVGGRQAAGVTEACLLLPDAPPPARAGDELQSIWQMPGEGLEALDHEELLRLERVLVRDAILLSDELDRLEKAESFSCPCGMIVYSVEAYRSHVLRCLCSVMWVCPVYGCDFIDAEMEEVLRHCSRESATLERRREMALGRPLVEGIHPAYRGIYRKDDVTIRYCARQISRGGTVAFLLPDQQSQAGIRLLVAQANCHARVYGQFVPRTEEEIRQEIVKTAPWVYMGSEPPLPSAPPSIPFDDQGYWPPEFGPGDEGPRGGGPPGPGPDDGGPPPPPNMLGRVRGGVVETREVEEVSSMMAGASVAAGKLLLSVSHGLDSPGSMQPGQVVSTRVVATVPANNARAPNQADPFYVGVVDLDPVNARVFDLNQAGRGGDGGTPGRTYGSAGVPPPPPQRAPRAGSSAPRAGGGKRRGCRGGRNKKKGKAPVQGTAPSGSWAEQVAQEEEQGGHDPAPSATYGAGSATPAQQASGARPKVRASSAMPRGCIPAGAEASPTLGEEVARLSRQEREENQSRRELAALRESLRDPPRVAQAPPCAVVPSPSASKEEEAGERRQGGALSGTPPWYTQRGRDAKRKEGRRLRHEEVFENFDPPKDSTPAQVGVLLSQYRQRSRHAYARHLRDIVQHQTRNLGAPMHLSVGEVPGLPGARAPRERGVEGGEGQRGRRAARRDSVGRNGGRATSVPHGNAAPPPATEDPALKRSHSTTQSSEKEPECEEEAADGVGASSAKPRKTHRRRKRRRSGDAPQSDGEEADMESVSGESDGPCSSQPDSPPRVAVPVVRVASQLRGLARFARTAEVLEAYDVRANDFLTSFQTEVVRRTPMQPPPEGEPLVGGEAAQAVQAAQAVKKRVASIPAPSPSESLEVPVATQAVSRPSVVTAGTQTQTAGAGPAAPVGHPCCPDTASRSCQTADVVVSEARGAGMGTPALVPPAGRHVPAVLRTGTAILRVSPDTRVTVYDRDGRCNYDVCTIEPTTLSVRGHLAALLECALAAPGSTVPGSELPVPAGVQAAGVAYGGPPPLPRPGLPRGAQTPEATFMTDEEVMRALAEALARDQRESPTE